MKEKQPKNTQLEVTLQKFGLSEKEIVIYQILLNLGKASVAKIITESGLKKGNTYDILYRLEGLELITRLRVDGTLHFQIEPPSKLLKLVQTQKEDLESATVNLKAMLPKLSSQYQISIGKPTITYYEGEQGIKEIFEEIYKSKSEPVFGCVDLEQSDKLLPSYIMNKLIPKRIKNKVFAYTLLASSPTAEKVATKDKEQLRSSKLVDKEKYPLPAEIDVYEDKIAMLTFDKENFIGLIIQNQQLATTLKSIFKLAFENQKK